MLRTLHVLQVEDSDTDAALIARELRRGGYKLNVERVDTHDAMVAALDRADWDIVISDYTMPTFDAPAALAVVRERQLDLPFIITSGTIDEETAVAALKAGACDFIVKSRLARLVPAVERELREKQMRLAKRRAEERAQESEQQYRMLFESCPLPMWVYEKKTLGFLAVNEAAVQKYGYTRDEFARMTLADIWPAEDVELLRADVARANGPDDGRTWRHSKKDATLISVEINARDFSYQGRAARLIVANDVTQRERLEEQLRQAQKMEAVGRLAGGVAHDFNNILSVILSYAEMIGAELKPEDPVYNDIEEIRMAGLRAKRLTTQLLAFSRQQIAQPRILDLGHLVGGTAKMVGRLLGADIELTTLLSGNTWPIKADPGQIEQIVMNLAVNARDAMPRGGKLTIEVSNVQLDETYARTHREAPAGPYVLLAVSDTGVGMDKATQTHMFEPFFTTKGPGHGTGLGLSTVFGIVKQSGGLIGVSSEPGAGTTFELYFPRAAGDVEVESFAPAEPETLTGSETILLVEDDDQLRAVARSILRRSGYVVIDAPNAGEALLVCEQHEAPIHLLLTDVILPRMSGRVLAERLAPVRPEMKVLFMSGYTDDAILQHGILESGVPYLQKPVTPAVLTRKVREVLSTRAAGRRTSRSL